MTADLDALRDGIISRALNKMHDAGYNEGYRAGLAKAKELLSVSMANILLHAGEMTAGEKRTVKAVLDWKCREIQSEMAKTVHSEPTREPELDEQASVGSLKA